MDAQVQRETELEMKHVEDYGQKPKVFNMAESHPINCPVILPCTPCMNLLESAEGETSFCGPQKLY